jgi:hypothetical protein
MTELFPNLALFFDVLITCLLGATIYFAIKLSKHLDSFRSNRSTMENLIRELSTQITRAQEGISVLDDLSASRGDELRKTISKAQAIIDELQVMTQSGDSLAQRLETMAVRNKAMIDEMDEKALGLVYPGTKKSSSPSLVAQKPRYEDTLNKSKTDTINSDALFMIRDPDFEEEDSMPLDDEFTSQAERDLAEALKRRTPKGR